MSRRTLLRNAATQLATWISMSFPQLPYARLLPFLPALVALFIKLHDLDGFAAYRPAAPRPSDGSSAIDQRHYLSSRLVRSVWYSVDITPALKFSRSE